MMEFFNFDIFFEFLPAGTKKFFWGRRKVGTTIFFGKITYVFWDMPPIKRGEEFIFERIFDFDRKINFFCLTKGRNNGNGERKNAGTME